MKPSALVLAWFISSSRLPERPTIVPLFSSSKSEHLKENLLISDYVLNEEILKKLTYANF